MMQITASMVKELRERTGCGMMECKKALVDVGGDIEKAIEEMRKRGLAKNDKLAARVASEGRIACAVSEDRKTAAMVEVNSETDFVANGDDFTKFVNDLAQLVLTSAPETAEALLELEINPGQTVKALREELLLKLGENLQIRRFERVVAERGEIGSYLHGSRIGVLAVAENDPSGEVAKDLAMHVAAFNPEYLSSDDISADYLEKEKEILMAQVADSGKPENILNKMVEGRLRKQLSEITLLSQPFLKDSDVTVEAMLKEKGATAISYIRYMVGEGIEKKEENFAEEVMAQVSGT
jgi:elongation factor Ts